MKIEINWKDLLVSFVIVIVTFIVLNDIFTMFTTLLPQFYRALQKIYLLINIINIILPFAFGSFYYFKKEKTKTWIEVIKISAILGLLFGFGFSIILSRFSGLPISFEFIFFIIPALFGGSIAYFISKRI